MNLPVQIAYLSLSPCSPGHVGLAPAPSSFCSLDQSLPLVPPNYHSHWQTAPPGFPRCSPIAPPQSFYRRFSPGHRIERFAPVIAPEAWSPPRASDLAHLSPELTFSRNAGRLAFLIALAVPAWQIETVRGAGGNIAGGELRFVAQQFERQADPVEPPS